MLMDRITLLDHQKRWGREPSPTAAVLDRLGPAESALYADLIGGHASGLSAATGWMAGWRAGHRAVL
jgi:hypothetical protein